MIDISVAWLESLGVKAAKKAEGDTLVALAENELELRVGAVLAQNFTDAQLDEFAATDEDKRLAWLEKAYPGYKKIVKKEYQTMSKQIREAPNKSDLIKSWSKQDG